MNEFRNNLLKRKEIVINLQHHGNPGFAVAGKKLAEHFKVGEDQIAVKGLKGHFGANEFIVQAFVYDSVADKSNIEAKKKEKKTAGGAN